MDYQEKEISSQPSQKPVIFQKVEELQRKINSLKTGIDNLRVQLKPILKSIPEPESDERKEEKIKPDSLSQELQDKINQLDYLYKVVGETCSRLEI